MTDLRSAVAAGVLGAEEAHRQLLQATVEVARGIFSAKAATIFLYDAETDELVFQAVHADDVADAYWRVIQRRAGGAFNVAAEPVVTPQNLARLFHARRVLPIPVRLLHALVDATWRLRLQETDSGWVEMAAGAPIMGMARARRELGWEPRTSSLDAIREVIEGMGAGAGLAPSPPLRPRRSLWGRP